MVTHASVGLMVDYATGKEYGTERIFHVTDSKILWEWANPDISKEERKNGEVQDAGLVFPYITSYALHKEILQSGYAAVPVEHHFL